MYAVIEAGGKQYRVSPGEKIKVEKMEAEEGAEVNFDKVLLVVEGDSVKLGTPYVEKAKVTAKVASQGRHKKVIIFKFKAKTRQRTKNGHRQPFTELEILKIA
ncbi:MAG: 50S ribosomal protein L21 [Candidatus Harrisonbacteria bacterium CG10_big_fil_rev_8_21_14_0_10_45_28]|uniref:Large ribosomal subunit protein bL21 n=1 Tax=Candidatus Harrisonbacteria bacterium CG10_big_fil_rev_8_21_14_0_10_45_28 TaxID=1974586 RepID=A0A2H0UMT0_9BACT|nr:MAG: 50S ribosomal protein L21 [Candidatus Harrisonbacteria bacterium CG10_big_fil_rev_8_21_14_0_10_45_28]